MISLCTSSGPVFAAGKAGGPSVAVAPPCALATFVRRSWSCAVSSFSALPRINTSISFIAVPPPSCTVLPHTVDRFPVHCEEAQKQKRRRRSWQRRRFHRVNDVHGIRSCTPPRRQVAFQEAHAAVLLLLRIGANKHCQPRLPPLAGQINSRREKFFAGLTRPAKSQYIPQGYRV
jgi:hypothetical protein